jgi:hypothetical protein
VDDDMKREFDRAHMFVENKKWMLANPTIIAALRNGTHVVVPREPTDAMLRAVGKTDDHAFAHGNQHGASFEELWAVALSAAPEPGHD